MNSTMNVLHVIKDAVCSSHSKASPAEMGTTPGVLDMLSEDVIKKGTRTHLQIMCLHPSVLKIGIVQAGHLFTTR